MKIIYLFKSIFVSFQLAYFTRNPFLIFKTSIVCKGEIHIKGRIYGLRNSHIQIEPNGKLVLGKGIRFSENINLRCGKSIYIGDFCRIAPNSIISDSIYKKLGTSSPELQYGEIYIGQNCFIGAFNLIIGSVRIESKAILGSHLKIRNKSNAHQPCLQHLLLSSCT